MLPPRSLRVLVVDDEPLGRRRLVDLLEREAGVELVGTAENGEAAIVAIRELEPDLVFLDVQMPRTTGLEVVRRIGVEAMPATIFVTAYDEYALEAFDLAAVDYLLKPYKDGRFEEAFWRARRKIELEGRGRLHEQLLALLRTAPTPPPPPSAASPYLDRIAVQMKGRLRIVPVAKIDYILASGPYAELHVGDARHVIRESMQKLEDQLDPESFVRIHRSAIVRLALVDTLLRSEGSEYQVQLRNGVRLRVGRSRRETLERRLGRSS